MEQALSKLANVSDVKTVDGLQKEIQAAKGLFCVLQNQ